MTNSMSRKPILFYADKKLDTRRQHEVFKSEREEFLSYL